MYTQELFDLVRELRGLGKSINEIAAEVGVAKSTVSMWTRDLPQPEKFTKEYRKAQAEKRHAEMRATRKPKEKLQRLIGGGYRWLIATPPGYKGKTYQDGRYIYEHRYVMEQKLGRYLTYNEVVHHINGDKLDNSPDNLEVLPRSKHSAEHGRQRGTLTAIIRCPECKNVFERPVSDVSRLGRGGEEIQLHFCTRHCTVRFYGVGSNKKQYTGIELAEAQRNNIIKTYRTK